MEQNEWDGLTLEEVLILLVKTKTNVEDISKFIAMLPENLKEKYRLIFKKAINEK